RQGRGDGEAAGGADEQVDAGDDQGASGPDQRPEVSPGAGAARCEGDLGQGPGERQRPGHDRRAAADHGEGPDGPEGWEVNQKKKVNNETHESHERRQKTPIRRWYTEDRDVLFLPLTALPFRAFRAFRVFRGEPSPCYLCSTLRCMNRRCRPTPATSAG